MPTSLEKLGLTPAKAALMAALAIGLGVVWGPQLVGLFSSSTSSGSGPAPVASRARPAAVVPRALIPQPASRSVEAASPASEKTNRKREESQPDLRLSLADALQHDPFRIPEWSPKYRHASGATFAVEADAETVEATFAQLQSQGVAMVLLGDGEATASIGEQTVHVGDVIQGFRVVEISTQGVRLTPVAGEDNGA
ncbi:hypothetical protein [Botrimarina hoheduenensis]|uniref:Uncharacterized protein n=1 Tax=Botrimarina hoheduenensis TaxID=2528000 RepID=A0A5C5VRF7_9BACT|nr:hypothetical protein [Botrimarina hoheduenensis]TWT40152.1 hypothetical protein Pla111_34160 [Botrimarina hoheduenensis]